MTKRYSLYMYNDSNLVEGGRRICVKYDVDIFVLYHSLRETLYSIILTIFQGTKLNN